MDHLIKGIGKLIRFSCKITYILIFYLNKNKFQIGLKVKHKKEYNKSIILNIKYNFRELGMGNPYELVTELTSHDGKYE